MKLRASLLLTLSVFLFVCTGCKKEMKDFSFSYTMESESNYKQTISFDSDKNYKAEVYDYYTFQRTRKYDPVIKEGQLTDEEFSTVKKLVEKVDFFSMKDSYGFDRDPDEALGYIMYTIHINADGKDKYISIRNTKANELPKGYIPLVQHLASLLDQKLDK